MPTLLRTIPIDYGTLFSAQQFYKTCGFSQIEVPWMVDPIYSIMTSPTNDKGQAYEVENDKHLVCSAEQGFLQLVHSGDLTAKELYFTISPCFRNEADDTFRCKQFMKLELFAFFLNVTDANKAMELFATRAQSFFKLFGVSTWRYQHDENSGVDLMCGDIELGSYGLRHIGERFFVYGTGLALPRFSLCENKGTHGIP